MSQERTALDADAARFGVDVGGTFTDVIASVDGDLVVHKRPSTPAADENGVLSGLTELAAESTVELTSAAGVVHGTTVATNAVLEGDWAETALVTTDGFRDVLEIGRQTRPAIYDLQAQKPDPIVSREKRYEVRERLDEDGGVLVTLDEAAVESVARSLDDDIESVAISFLFAFQNADHERRVETLLRETGVDVAISRSSDVLPEIREYERTLATALNAALVPVMDAYLEGLEAGLTEVTPAAYLRIVGSAGGLLSAERARSHPVRTLLSGPAAGVRGATFVASRHDEPDLITMDMGGTSCDVSLVTGGEPTVSTEGRVGPYPVSVPMVDVHTVGAGGGSIAWIDEGDALRVGPRSAGAKPGPICYGRGGTEPTVTDAQYLLGRLEPGRFPGATFETDESAVREAFSELGEAVGMDANAVAHGVVEVANASMERAIRVVSVERGYDPRSFALVAFGGAGPVHAAALADALAIPRVLVPRHAGVCSALGLLASDVLVDRGTSFLTPLCEVEPADVEEGFHEFESEARDRLAAEGIEPSVIELDRRVECRYRGQSFDLAVPTPSPVDEDALESIASRFHERHHERYGHAAPDEPIELVTIRLRARGRVDPPDIGMVSDTESDDELVSASVSDSGTDANEGAASDTPASTLDEAHRETRPVVFANDRPATPVYDRSQLSSDMSFSGPAIVEGVESTVVVPPDWSALVRDDGTLILVGS